MNLVNSRNASKRDGTNGATSREGASRSRVALWWATPFFTGAIIMAQELVAFRLYAPYFGYSIYVWGSMISVVMAALALGYALGGFVADRSQTDLSLYGILLGSTLYQLGILLSFHSMLPGFAGMGDFAGTSLASLIIFGPPMTAAAAACPFVIRLLVRSAHIGTVAGRVYAISTVGSIAGIFATSFFLVPQLGTQMTLEAICVLSAVTAASGLAMHVRAALLLIVLVAAAMPFMPPPNWSPNTVWAADSPYNLVRVIRNGKWLLLKLNGDMGAHTISDERNRWTGHYYDDFALGPLLSPARSLLVLGLGGGASIAATKVAAPDIDVDAVEIDPKVVEAAYRFFGMNFRGTRLHVHVADARPWLSGNRNQYDIVHVDLYQGGPYIPFYLLTVEFFEEIRAHMTSDGVLMMNVFDDSPTQELSVPTVATLEKVFPSVAVLSVGFGNRMVLAFRKATSKESIRARLKNFSGVHAVTRVAHRAENEIVDLDVPPGTLVFSDDYAPVEEITRRILDKN